MKIGFLWFKNVYTPTLKRKDILKFCVSTHAYIYKVYKSVRKIYENTE